MLLPAAGVHQEEDAGQVSCRVELGDIQSVFLQQARVAAVDADEPVVLRHNKRPEAHAEQDGGAGTIVLLRF